MHETMKTTSLARRHEFVPILKSQFRYIPCEKLFHIRLQTNEILQTIHHQNAYIKYHAVLITYQKAAHNVCLSKQ